MSLNRSGLIQRLSAKYPQLSATDMDMAVKVIQEAMTEALMQGQRIEIRGFGSFTLRYRRPRQARNPKTGEKIQLKGKFVPYFKASRHRKQ